MRKTQPVDWFGKPYEGYIMNTQFSKENTIQIMRLIDKISVEFGDSLNCMPAEALHITLLDWIAPLINYDGKNKSDLFNIISNEYDEAVTNIIKDEKRITVEFDTINVSPSTIFISGHDNGEFNRIRSKYLDSVELLPNTKLPPNIIHSSLARFTKEIDMQKVEDFIKQHSINLTQTVNQFNLVHSYREPLLEYKILKTYSLK